MADQLLDANSGTASSAMPSGSLDDLIFAGLNNSSAQESVTPAAGAADANQAQSATGQGNTTSTTSDEKVPWHNDPRWKDWQSEKATLREQAAKAIEYEAKLKEMPDLQARIADFERFAPTIEHLKAQGYDSSDALRAALEAEEQQQFEKNLFADLQGRVDRRELDLQTAQNMQAATLERRQAEKDRLEAQRTLQTAKDYIIGSQVDSLKEKFKYADFDTIRERAAEQYGKPGFDPAKYIQQEAQKSHSRFVSLLEQQRANDVTQEAQTPRPPENGQGNLQPAPAAATDKTLLQRARETPWGTLLGWIDRPAT